MSDHTSPQEARSPLGDVSYTEAGDVAFVLLVLRTQAERIIGALDAKDEESLSDSLAGLRNVLKSSERHVSPARRMAAWSTAAAEGRRSS